MPQFISLVGKTFGNLKVVEQVEHHISLKGNRKTRWRCVCACGNIKDIVGRDLKSGHTKSCGCLKNISRQETNIIGHRFNSLVVIGKGQRYVDKRGRSQAKWICKCDCGNTTIASSSHLRSGKHRSCGCIRESKVASQLKSYFKETYFGIPEYKILKIPDTNFYAPYDIYIPNGIFIEIQGRHHYESNHWFHHIGKTSYSRRKYIDKLKKEYAEQNGTYIEIDLRKIKTVEDAIKYVEQRL